MTLKQKKILLIGFTPADEKVMYSALSECIINSKEQFSHQEDHACDVIFIYCTVPQDCLESIRKLNRHTQGKIPLVLLTERHQAKMFVAAMQEGVSDSLTREELVPAILKMVTMRAIEHKKWEQIALAYGKEDSVNALKDSATNLFNRPYFETRLAEEIKRSERYHFPLTLSVFRVETFSKLRQKFGPAAVENLLREMGQLITRDLRSSDLLARLSDDLFAMLLPHTSQEEARTVWKRHIGNIAQHPFIVEGKNIFITVRVLLTGLNGEVEDIDAMIRQVKNIAPLEGDASEPVMLYRSRDNFLV